MIIYANGKVLGTDPDGNTSEVGVTGPTGDELKVSNIDSQELLSKIWKELKKLNIHLSLVTDVALTNEDVGSL
jgi:hypothetical protein